MDNIVCGRSSVNQIIYSNIYIFFVIWSWKLRYQFPAGIVAAILDFWQTLFILFGKWLINRNLTLRVQNSLLFCLRRTVSEICHFQILYFNIIFFYGISPKSRKAGDNRGFYCTLMVSYIWVFTQMAQILLLGLLSLRRTVFEILQFLIQRICWCYLIF